ncbi:MAG: DUF3185 domain-containing protein [Vicinamibacterales bacterium]
MRIVGITLIVLGIAALALGGFSFTTRERVLDAGPLKVDTTEEHTIPVAPIAGVVAVVAGIALVMVPGRSRV